MRKILLFLALSFTSLSLLRADNWTQAVSLNAGNKVDNASVNTSTTAATALTDQTRGFSSANTVIFNNSAFTLWIGSNTANLPGTGIPVLASTTYKTDGQFTGILYGVADPTAGAATPNVRILYYLKNDSPR
jgi:hypothetical protein